MKRRQNRVKNQPMLGGRLAKKTQKGGKQKGPNLMNRESGNPQERIDLVGERKGGKRRKKWGGNGGNPESKREEGLLIGIDVKEREGNTVEKEGPQTTRKSDVYRRK